MLADAADDGCVDGGFGAAAVDAYVAAEAPEEATRQAIVACVQASCGVPLAEALDVQTKLSSEFLAGPIARKGAVGQDYAKTVRI